MIVHSFSTQYSIE